MNPIEPTDQKELSVYESPIKKHVLLMAPKINFMTMFNLAIGLAAFLVLLKFHGQYDDSRQQIERNQQSIEKLETVIAEAQQFIKNDCAFQYYRTTNAFARLNKTIDIEKAEKHVMSDNATYSAIASAHRKQLNDSIAENYWLGLSGDANRLSDLANQRLVLDQQSLAALAKTPVIESACSVKADSKSRSFVTPGPGPGPGP